MIIKIIIFVFVVGFVMSPLFRCILFNLHRCGYYTLYDIFDYFRKKKWKEFNYYGIQMYIGMFGHGKTLSMTHDARLIYDRFGDKVRFISNYKLNDIPYIPLINFNQLVDLGEEEDSKYIGTVVLIDEIENVLSHRNFANFPLALLHTLTQQRKKKVYILCSAQRFFMVDKLFRAITTNVIDCNKYWRFQHQEIYDAWDVEQSMNYKLIRRLYNSWFFVRNIDYDSYDTSEMIKKRTAQDFISNEAALVRKGLDSMSNPDAVVHVSKAERRKRKNT